MWSISFYSGFLYCLCFALFVVINGVSWPWRHFALNAHNTAAVFLKWYQRVQFSSVPWLIGLSGEHEEQFSRDPLPVFSAGGPCQQVCHDQGCPLFDVVHPAFPLPTMASPALQGALKDGFGEAVRACDMPEPCKFPSLDSCQKRFLWTHKEIDLAPHPVVSLVLQVGDTEKFSYALGSESLDPLLSQQAASMSHNHSGSWYSSILSRRFYSLNCMSLHQEVISCALSKNVVCANSDWWQQAVRWKQREG